MNREDYIERLNVIFSDNENARDVFTEQINNYYNVEIFLWKPQKIYDYEWLYVKLNNKSILLRIFYKH